MASDKDDSTRPSRAEAEAAVVITSYSIHYTKLYEPIADFPEQFVGHDVGESDDGIKRRAIGSYNFV